jgi:hypothetical protein
MTGPDSYRDGDWVIGAQLLLFLNVLIPFFLSIIQSPDHPVIKSQYLECFLNCDLSGAPDSSFSFLLFCVAASCAGAGLPALYDR